jgi:hypothetical protein
MIRRWLLAAALAPLWVYRRLISPLLPQSCRFYPSCSAYAEQALKTHGVVRGSWLAVHRLARCHPWTPGGVDHVPPPRTRGTTHSGGHSPAERSSASSLTGV